VEIIIKRRSTPHIEERYNDIESIDVGVKLPNVELTILNLTNGGKTCIPSSEVHVIGEAIKIRRRQL
jgi:hypothetical protein